MKIRLKRKLAVTAFEVEGDLGKGEERNELLAILKLSNNGDITPARVNKELLGRKPGNPHGFRLLEQMAEIYELIETPHGRISENSSYNLTEEGESVLDLNSEKVYPTFST